MGTTEADNVGGAALTPVKREILAHDANGHGAARRQLLRAIDRLPKHPQLSTRQRPRSSGCKVGPVSAFAVVDASTKVRIGGPVVTVIEGTVAFTAVSDRNQKENLKPVDGEEVLEKI